MIYYDIFGRSRSCYNCKYRKGVYCYRGAKRVEVYLSHLCGKHDYIDDDWKVTVGGKGCGKRKDKR